MNTLRRRQVLGGLGTFALTAAVPRAALADWRKQYPVLRYGVITTETGEALSSVYKTFDQYLGRALGVKTEMFFAAEYAAVIEALKSNRVHLAQLYAGSYAAAFDAIQGDIEPLAMNVANGAMGYHSYLVVKADSPYQKLEDLKGKNLGLVDPNSTSGNNVPRFAMNKMGIKPEEFFANVVYTGSHENAIIALEQGQVDGAFNWWNDDNESMLRRMERKGMAKYDDYRMIFKSDMIVNSPVAMLSALPDDLKAQIKDAFFNVDKNDPEAFKVLTDGEAQVWAPTSHKDYEVIVELNQFVDTLRKQ